MVGERRGGWVVWWWWGGGVGWGWLFLDSNDCYIPSYSECTRIPFCLFSCWITPTPNLTIIITIDYLHQTQYLSKFLQKSYTHLKSTPDLSSLSTYALPYLTVAPSKR